MKKHKIKIILFFSFCVINYKVLFSQNYDKTPARSLTRDIKENPQNLVMEDKKPKIKIENVESTSFMLAEEQSKGLYRFFGRIKVTIRNGYFLADEVILDTKRKEIFAQGNLEYFEKNARITVDKVIYDYEREYGIFYNGSGYKEPVYFTGIYVRGLGENRFEISDSFFTSCSAEKPHYHFSAKRIYILDNDELLGIGVWYHVGGVPLIPLPFYYSNNWGTGVITQFGFSNITGYFLQNTYQFSIPAAFINPVLPFAYRFSLDYYEKKGYHFGIEMYRFTNQLSYILDLGYAEYRRYEVIPDFRSRNRIRITNRIQQPDGNYTDEIYKWYKFFSLISYNQFDFQKNYNQKLVIKSQNYNHRLFEYEFGGRYIPESTLPALYKTGDSRRGIIHNNNEYSFFYNGTFDDLTINLSASRIKTWRESSNFKDSKYIPVNDVIPNLDITKNIHLGTFYKLPFYWNLAYHYDMNKIYLNEKPYYSTTNSRFETHIRSFISFYPFITLSPLWGYGSQKLSLVNENMPENAFNDYQTYLKKQSYEYIYQNYQLILGPSELNLELIHKNKKSFKEEAKDTSALNPNQFDYRQKVKETDVKLNFYPFEFFSLTAESTYNHKKFEYHIPYVQRWSYPVVRTEFYLNFLNPFKPSRYHMLSKRRIQIFELKITNDYVYDLIQTRDHSNLLGINLIIANFDLVFLKRLRYLEIGFSWYHVYYQPQLDHMRYLAKLDLQLTKQIFFEMEIESRLTQPERYTNQNQECKIVDNSLRCIPQEWIPENQKQTNFFQDVINSTGINGKEKKINSAFNTGYFQGTLIFDLHDWELRFGYEMEQKSTFAGLNTINIVNYYDNKIFFSFNFVVFDIGGLARRPSRFIINRQKVNPFDIAKTEFYIQ